MSRYMLLILVGALLAGCTASDKNRPFNRYLYDHGVVK